jgi:hypothetical protein
MPTLRSITRLALGAAILFTCAGAHAQHPCLLANPSFEVGTGLTGWNWFGDVVVTTDPTVHGARAVSIGGPYEGNWAISAVWQSHAAAPGARFDAAVRVRHPSSDPLTGAGKAILNIEWRDAADQLISYETHDVLAPSDPTDTWFEREITSGPAPAGTASARLLLAILQSPAQEPGRVIFDLAGFLEQTTPSYDDAQWGDFPGGQTVQFGGHDWRIKGPGIFGPGPNWFSDSPSNVALVQGDLRLAIRGTPGNWSSAEVTLADALGYGDYILTTRGRLDTLAPNVVLGFFLWQYPPCYDPANTWNQHNEIDVEISRWGDPAADVAQFVVQPYDAPGNISRFDIAYAPDELVSYAFRWLPDRIEFRAWRGGPDAESPASTIRTWVYTGQHLPRPEQPRVHLNLWYFGAGPTDGLEQVVVIDDFVFHPPVQAPACAGDITGDGVTNASDFTVLAGFFGQTVAPGEFGDLNSDGLVNAADFVILAGDFGCGG